jgi:hypothetical protein
MEEMTANLFDPEIQPQLRNKVIFTHQMGAADHRFPVELVRFRALHAPFSTERRTLCLDQCWKFGLSRAVRDVGLTNPGHIAH